MPNEGVHGLLVRALRYVWRLIACATPCAIFERGKQEELADALHDCRGTFLGAPWGPFHDVRKVWDDYFGRKSYRAHSMGIASKAPTCRMLALHVSVRPGLNLISCAPDFCMDAAMAPSLRTGLGSCEKECQACSQTY